MTTAAPVSPDVIFDTLFAYQQTAALKAGIDLGLFTALDGEARDPAALASALGASERGVRILCDYLVTIGLLAKAGSRYSLVPASAAFLSQRSPMYMGTVANFLTLPQLKRNFDNLTETVRTGTVATEGNTVSVENPLWLDFARAMVPMAVPGAHAIGTILGIESAGPLQVLDIAAGHGMYGIVLAQRNPEVRVAAADWAPVLEIAREHARAAGVESRFRTIPGDAFATDFGAGFGVALVTNFLHHFDPAQCTAFLKKVAAALSPGGQVVIVEFVPNPDRISPPMPARFSLTMLAGTPNGDAYTLAELTDMLEAAGFHDVRSHGLPTPEMVVIART
ncbi:MAG TPA: methyltransferase [Vicinamibacterales bacterium]|nr:methyltransferase [Vicinamibacterales bacterium]